MNGWLWDYEDWLDNSPEAIAHRAARAVEMRAQRDQLLERFDVIHGHFVADKYLDLFPSGYGFRRVLARPRPAALSNYFFLRNNPQLQDHDRRQSVSRCEDDKTGRFELERREQPSDGVLGEPCPLSLLQ